MDANKLVDRAFESVSRLEELYWQRATDGDTKAFSNIESCCELYLKLLAIIAKPDAQQVMVSERVVAPASTMIDFSKLSDAALQEILNTLTNK